MKLRIHGLTEEQLKQRAPEILQKAAKGMGVVLVEKEPEFDDKSYLPHTELLVSKLEDWYYQQLHHPLDTVKNVLIRNIAGKEIRRGGVVNRSQIIPKKSIKNDIQLQKSRIALLHMKNILTNPRTNKRTRRSIYTRAKQIVSAISPEERMNVIDVFNEIRDLA